MIFGFLGILFVISVCVFCYVCVCVSVMSVCVSVVSLCFWVCCVLPSICGCGINRVLCSVWFNPLLLCVYLLVSLDTCEYYVVSFVWLVL